MNILKIFFMLLLAIIFASQKLLGSNIIIYTDNSICAFNKNWKSLAEWFPRWQPPTYESQMRATAKALHDWKIDADSGYYRITISQSATRRMFPDHYPYNRSDWNFNAIGIDRLLNSIDPQRKINIIFHILGYPKWLMAPKDTVPAGQFAGWWVGDTKLPVFQGSDSLGLVRFSELITEFCNHYDSLGVSFAMTIMGEPNLAAHWTGSWDDANRYYKAFVDGVNASRAGEKIKVGGLVWAAGSQAGVASLDTIIVWAKYWHNFCHEQNIRHDFICYHHYWHSPERFDSVAAAFEQAFPGHEFWITEWNYKFSKVIPFKKYKEYVTGMAGATGNLEFIRHAQNHPKHRVMSFFSIIGYYHGYGICHWRNTRDWDYTASGHALKWLANFNDTELEVFNDSPFVHARASGDNSNVKILLWNYDSATDTVNLTVRFPFSQNVNYEVWRMDKDNMTKSVYYYPAPPPYGDSTALYLPVPYLTDQGEITTENFVKQMVIDSNEIAYISLQRLTHVEEPIQNNYPGSFKLFQNFPNPFNASTTIKYQIPANKEVKLLIYNIKSQLVKILINSHKAPGFHSIVWDGTDNLGNVVNSGVYFYKLIADDNASQTRKLLLLK